MTLVALSLLCNVDHGVLPAASIAIKTDLGLNNLQYGMVGSSVFAGLTTGKLKLSNSIFRLDRINFCILKIQHKNNSHHGYLRNGHFTHNVYPDSQPKLSFVLPFPHRLFLGFYIDLLSGMVRHFRIHR
jgi:hypothetical protein